jgi:hypothetical protein
MRFVSSTYKHTQANAHIPKSSWRSHGAAAATAAPPAAAPAAAGGAVGGCAAKCAFNLAACTRPTHPSPRASQSHVPPSLRGSWSGGMTLASSTGKSSPNTWICMGDAATGLSHTHTSTHSNTLTTNHATHAMGNEQRNFDGTPHADEQREGAAAPTVHTFSCVRGWIHGLTTYHTARNSHGALMMNKRYSVSG